MSESITQCRYCSTSFERDTSRKQWQGIRFCSDRCRKDFAAKKKRDQYVPKVATPTQCLVCGEVFTQKVSSGRKQIYCSDACYLKKKAAKSHEKWAKERQTKGCAHCGAQFLPEKFQSGRQTYCRRACRIAAINQIHMGKYRRSGDYRKEMKMMRPAVLERDKACLFCGTDEHLHIHHWDNSGGKDNFNNSLENLGALCDSCHWAVHNVTLAKVDGKWCLDGKIFEIINIDGPIPIKS